MFCRASALVFYLLGSSIAAGQTQDVFIRYFEDQTLRLDY